jgi:hypothetical protein
LTADVLVLVNVTLCEKAKLPFADNPKSSVETEGVGGTPGATAEPLIAMELLPVFATISSVPPNPAPGAVGANRTTTVHDVPAAIVAGNTVGHVPPLRVKPLSPTIPRDATETEPAPRFETVAVSSVVVCINRCPNAIGFGAMIRACPKAIFASTADAKKTTLESNLVLTDLLSMRLYPVNVLATKSSRFLFSARITEIARLGREFTLQRHLANRFGLGFSKN